MLYFVGQGCKVLYCRPLIKKAEMIAMIISAFRLVAHRRDDGQQALTNQNQKLKLKKN